MNDKEKSNLLNVAALRNLVKKERFFGLAKWRNINNLKIGFEHEITFEEIEAIDNFMNTKAGKETICIPEFQSEHGNLFKLISCEQIIKKNKK